MKKGVTFLLLKTLGRKINIFSLVNITVMSKKVESFEDLIIWQESLQLSIDVYQCLTGCKEYGLRDQIQKSSISIPSNIAEGFERGSDKEFIRFLYFSKGSAGELRTQLYIAKKLQIIQEGKCLAFIDKTKRIAALIQKLIQKKKDDIKMASQKNTGVI